MEQEMEFNLGPEDVKQIVELTVKVLNVVCQSMGVVATGDAISDVMKGHMTAILEGIGADPTGEIDAHGMVKRSIPSDTKVIELKLEARPMCAILSLASMMLHICDVVDRCGTMVDKDNDRRIF